MATATLNTIPEGGENTTLSEIISANGICQDCRHDLVTSRFLHLDGREFFLCNDCFHAADHEEDYGRDFEEVSYLQQDEEDEEEEDGDGFIDPGEQDDDFALGEDDRDYDEAYVGSSDWWEDEIDRMRMNGSYALLTSGLDDWMLRAGAGLTNTMW